MPLAGCGKNDKKQHGSNQVDQMPKPTKETCSGDYLEKHKDLYERYMRYDKGAAANSPKDVLDYEFGCAQLYKTGVAP